MKYILKASTIDHRGERKELRLDGNVTHKSLPAAQRAAEEFLRELRTHAAHTHPSVWIESAPSSPYRFEAQRDTEEQLVTRESDGARFWWIPSSGTLRQWGARVDDVISRSATSPGAVRKILRGIKSNPVMKKRRTKRNPVTAIKNKHFIAVKYIGPTDTRGSRVSLTSFRFPKDSISDGYSHDFNGTFEQARHMLAQLGYTIAAEGELPKGYIVAVDQFKPLREALREYKLRNKGLGKRAAAALSARLGPTKANPRSRPASAVVEYSDGSKRWYALRDGNRIGWTTSHAMASSFSLKEARGLQLLMGRRGIRASVTPN